MTATKVCSRCTKRKALGKFSAFKHGRLGVQAWCKACVNEYKREQRRAANPEWYAEREARRAAREAALTKES